MEYSVIVIQLSDEIRSRIISSFDFPVVCKARCSRVAVLKKDRKVDPAAVRNRAFPPGDIEEQYQFRDSLMLSWIIYIQRLKEARISTVKTAGDDRGCGVVCSDGHSGIMPKYRQSSA